MYHFLWKMLGIAARITKDNYLPKTELKSWDYFGSGNTHLESKNYRAAIADYDIAISMDGDRIYYFINRGIAKANLGDKEGALSDYEKAKALDPEEFERSVSRGLPLLS